MPSAYRVEAPPMVRVAGLPVGALANLRFDRTAAVVGDLLARAAWLAAEGGTLADELYAAIGALSTDRSAKPRLVGLRRAVHAGRRPRAAEWNEETARALPAALAERVRRWVEAVDQRAGIERDLAEVLAAEAVEKLDALRRLAAVARFRHGLAHSSPALADELDKWLGGGRPGRQMLHRVARYLSRAAMKTSPYSTFTSTGAGRWTDAGGDALRFDPGAPEYGLLDLHGATVPALEQAVAGRPELRGALRVRVNPSAVAGGGRLTFLGAGTGEPVVEITASPEVTGCLAAAATASTVDDLRKRLLDGSGDAWLAERVAAFVDKLADLGLLEVRLGVADQADDPLGAVADWLDANGGPAYRAAAAACRDLRAELVAPAEPDEVTAHRARLRTIQGRVGDLGTLLGQRWEEFGTARTGAVHENTVFATPVADLGTAAWRPALDDLDAIRRWLALHDPGLPLRLVLGTYCRERFGAGAAVPFVRLHRALQDDMARDAPPGRTIGAAQLRHVMAPFPDPADCGVDRLRDLLAARGESARAVLRHEPDAAGIVRIDGETLAGTARGWPAPASAACFVQPWIRAGELRLALNAVLSGHGRGRSRWMRLAARAAAHHGAEPPGGDPAGVPHRGPVTAEVSGVFGYPFNVRLPLHSHEIDYPYTVSARPADERIPLADLVVVHDPGSDTVRLCAGDLDVLPVHAGLQAEMLLPPAYQLLVRGFGTSPPLLHAGQSLFVPDVAPERPDQVFALPRVEVGRVTLQRATWIARYPYVPLRAKGEADAAYLLRLRGWLRAAGIPDRCFVQAVTQGSRSSQPLRLDKTRKPLYVDFDNWFLCAVFERMLTQPAELVVFREALPAPEDALGLDPADPRVAEVIVEVSEVPGVTECTERSEGREGTPTGGR